MSSLANKVILITGSSDGIGAGIAVYLADYKPRLVLTGRNPDRLQKVKERCIEAGLLSNQILTVQCDVKEDDDLKRLIDQTVNHFSQLDVLVNNAGVGFFAGTQNTDINKYDELMRINVRAPFLLCQLAIPHLIKTKGNIINISSSLSTKGMPEVTAYCMSKAALDHLTRCLAAELGPHKVRVNTISPGYIVTDIFSKAGVSKEQADELNKFNVSLTTLGRAGYPEDIAKCVKFLASDDADYITGDNLVVDGGRNVAAPKLNLG